MFVQPSNFEGYRSETVGKLLKNYRIPPLPEIPKNLIDKFLNLSHLLNYPHKKKLICQKILNLTKKILASPTDLHKVRPLFKSH